MEEFIVGVQGGGPDPPVGIASLVVGGERKSASAAQLSSPKAPREWIPSFDEFCTPATDNEFRTGKQWREHLDKQDANIQNHDQSTEFFSTAATYLGEAEFASTDSQRDWAEKKLGEMFLSCPDQVAGYMAMAQGMFVPY